MKALSLKSKVTFICSLAASFASSGPLKAQEAAYQQSPVSDDKNAHFSHVVPIEALLKQGEWIESGLRMERDSEGLQVAATVFPSGGEPQGMALPEHLGGGYLFFQATGTGGMTSTALYRSKSWTGKLSPLSLVPFGIRQIHSGFDRLYLIGITQQIALDVADGRVLPLAPLPPLATIEQLAFEGRRRGLVQGPVQGVLYTRDAGTTWRQLSNVATIAPHLDSTELRVRTEQGTKKVHDDGSLGPIEVNDPVGGSLEAGRATSSLEDQQAALALVSSGVMYNGWAWAIHQGALLRARFGSRLEISRNESQKLLNQSCLGIGTRKKNDLPLFLCQSQSNGTQVLTFGDTKKDHPLRVLWQDRTARKLLARGDGSVIIHGSCQTDPSTPSTPTDFCHVHAGGTSEIRLASPLSAAVLAGGAQPQPAFAINRHEAWTIRLNPQENKIQAHRIWTASKLASSKDRRLTWSLPTDPSLNEFLTASSLLPGATLLDGELAVWAVNQNKLVGLSLGDDEEPSVGALQRPLSRALIHGSRVLFWGASGFVRQSLDGGIHFQEVSFPYRSGDGSPLSNLSSRSSLQMGCSDVGCIVGRHLRFGWSSAPLPELSLPKRVTFPATGPGKYQLSCARGNVQSKPRVSKDPQSLPPFWEERAPNVPHGMEAFVATFPREHARLYTFGPKEASWVRGGRAMLKFVDPWSPRVVKSSALTHHIFADSQDARKQLGLDESSTSLHTLALDPDGEGGVLLLRTRDTATMMSFSRDAPIEIFENGAGFELGNLAGAVISHELWYVASTRGSRFTVYRLEGGEIVPFTEFSLGSSGTRGAQLIRTKDGSLGIALEGDSGLFVYPIGDDASLGETIVVPHQANRPRACPMEATGYIVDRPLSVAPYLEDTKELPLKVHGLQARWVIGHGAPCLEALAARSRMSRVFEAQPTRPNSIPLNILNTSSTGTRIQLECH